MAVQINTLILREVVVDSDNKFLSSKIASSIRHLRKIFQIMRVLWGSGDALPKEVFYLLLQVRMPARLFPGVQIFQHAPREARAPLDYCWGGGLGVNRELDADC